MTTKTEGSVDGSTDQPAVHYLDFERPVAEFEKKLAELRAVSGDSNGIAVDKQLADLYGNSRSALKSIYSKLTPWQRTQIARHPDRPRFQHYRAHLFEEFQLLSGDRRYSDDQAIICGLARFRNRSLLVLGQEKGTDTSTRLSHNFGMARPEGYRKASRLFELAERFRLPIVSFVDTAGAFPGIGAEERGQAEAIAKCIDTSLGLTVPNISIIIGEGGSGGAIAIATVNALLMLEHSIYTVASPEASASILWRDSSRAKDAATNMRITAQDLFEFGFCREIISEPLGGAHRDPIPTVESVGDSLEKVLDSLGKLTPEEILLNRRSYFASAGTTTC